MARRSLFTGSLVVFLVTLSSSVWAMPSHILTAPITEVVVYRDQAQVNRAGKIKLTAGVSEIKISGLPRQLRDESLQITGRGLPMTLLDTQIETGIADSVLPARLADLIKQMEALEQQRDQQQDKLATLKQRRQFLERIEAAATHPPAEGNSLPSLQGWRDYLQFLSTEWQALLDSQRTENQRLKDLNEEIKALKANIDRYQAEQRQPAKTARIRVHSDQAGEVTLNLSYQVRGASWSPIYDAQVSDQQQQVQLRYRALVRQQTGEPWQNARLILSTAQPSIHGNAPELPVWSLRPYEPPIATRSRDTMSAPQAMKLGSAPVMQEDAVMMSAGARVETGMTAARFVIRNPVSVAPDNSPQAVTITEMTLDGSFEYTLVPVLSNHAYLQVETTYGGEAPLLPGMVNVFLNQTLVGQTLMPQTQPGETLQLPMGINEAIKVEHKQIKRLAETAGLINKTRRTHFEYATLLENNSPQKANFLVKDRIPVTEDERIKVTLREPDVSHRVENQPGELHWRFTLEPGAKRTVRLQYTVEHPEDMRVPGL